jgi:L-ribulokinase
MQIYADVTGLQLSTIGSEQGPALGSAIHAAVAAGMYADIREAAAAMGAEPGEVYTPIPENAAAYEELFQEYRTLHDYFGRGSNDVMHRLKAIQRKAAGSPGGAAASLAGNAGLDTAAVEAAVEVSA